MRNNNFIEGVKILEKYIPEERKESFDLHAEHDQFWFCEYEWVPEGPDKERLDELGWFEDEDSWSCFT